MVRLSFFQCWIQPGLNRVISFLGDGCFVGGRCYVQGVYSNLWRSLEVKQGSLNYPIWGDQTMQIYGDAAGISH